MYIIKRLDELVDVNPRVALEKGNEYPFVEMEVVNPGFRYVSADTKRAFSSGGAKFLQGDTLFARITPCLENGKIAQYKSSSNQPAFGSTEFIVFRCRPGISDASYVFYLAISNIVRKPAEKSMSGASGRQRADLAAIKEIEVPSPPLAIQRRIAAVLSAYDDLIENNQRRIAILEEMARSLYRKWFVEFHFPGHEGVEIVERDGVRAPEGWEVTTVREVSSYINRGVAPKYNDSAAGIVINQKCIRDRQLNTTLARRHESRVPVEKLVGFGDVLINSTGVGTLGRVAQCYQILENYTVDSHVSIVRPNSRVGVDYFGYFICALETHFESLGVGSTGQTELGRETIAKTPFILPSRQIQERFGSVVAPMRQTIEVLRTKNTNLRRTRDLLLPRLVSGELDVSELEIAGAEELMADA